MIGNVVPDALQDRRSTLKLIGLTAGMVCTSSAAHPANEAPIVETRLGKVRGRRVEGVETFLGIAYGATTAGVNRFRPPVAPAPWQGVLDAVTFGASAPQKSHAAPERAPFAEIRSMSEDCLSLNVYTPSSLPSERRPVMVWFHGGGWRTGAASAPGLRGYGLARLGDVVLVTVNHRLDTLGFLPIPGSDERFADAGNLGVLDMVAALRWVRDNIAVFGGDAQNVTICGQSGGGAKVAALLGAPAARGLFHKAIAMSCSGCLRLMQPEEASKIAFDLARNLGIPKLTGEVLQTLPASAIIEASAGSPRPVIDGRTFSAHPYDPVAASSAAGIPLLIGNVETETRIQLAGASLANFAIDRTELGRRIARFLTLPADEVDRICDVYAATYPADRPGDLLGRITTDYIYVRNTRHMADLQATGSPLFSYMFMHRTPVMGGILRAAHECELPFVFGTAKKAAVMVGTGPQIPLLTHMMIRTWSTFARTGSPQHAGLPAWPKHVSGSDAAMHLDVASRFAELDGCAARKALDQLPWYEYSRPLNYTAT